MDFRILKGASDYAADFATKCRDGYHEDAYNLLRKYPQIVGELTVEDAYQVAYCFKLFGGKRGTNKKAKCFFVAVRRENPSLARDLIRNYPFRG